MLHALSHLSFTKNSFETDEKIEGKENDNLPVIMQFTNNEDEMGFANDHILSQ